MVTKERLVKCYKFKKNFKVWEETLESGETYISGCPFVVTSGNKNHPLCNGLNEWGQPCVYSNQYPANESHHQ